MKMRRSLRRQLLKTLIGETKKDRLIWEDNGFSIDRCYSADFLEKTFVFEARTDNLRCFGVVVLWSLRLHFWIWMQQRRLRRIRRMEEQLMEEFKQKAVDDLIRMSISRPPTWPGDKE